MSKIRFYLWHVGILYSLPSILKWWSITTLFKKRTAKDVFQQVLYGWNTSHTEQQIPAISQWGPGNELSELWTEMKGLNSCPTAGMLSSEITHTATVDDGQATSRSCMQPLDSICHYNTCDVFEVDCRYSRCRCEVHRNTAVWKHIVYICEVWGNKVQSCWRLVVYKYIKYANKLRQFSTFCPLYSKSL